MKYVLDEEKVNFQLKAIGVGLVLFTADLVFRFIPKLHELRIVEKFKIGLTLCGIIEVSFFRLSCVLSVSGMRFDDERFIYAHWATIILFNVIAYCGFFLHMEGMQNITILYTICYFVCAIFNIKWFNNWVRGSIVSLVGYRFSLYLHSHPDFLSDIFLK